MIGSAIRSVVAVVVALALAMVLIVAVEGVGAVVHPFPPGVDPSDIEVGKAHVAKCPQWFLALVVPAWGFTTFASAWLATRLGTGRHPAHGIFVGVLLLAAAAMNMFMLPYPAWFEIANLVVFPLAIYCGCRLGRERAAGPIAVAGSPAA